VRSLSFDFVPRLVHQKPLLNSHAELTALAPVTEAISGRVARTNV